MSNLKDALMKAGLSSAKTQNMRANTRGRVKQKSEKHQEARNFCEACDLIHPDVERYKHRNPTVDAEWICASCADREQISDETRVTHQSDFAKKGRFRREYGATKDFSEESHSKGKPRSTSFKKRGGSTDKGPHKKHQNRKKASPRKTDGNGDVDGNC